MSSSASRPVQTHVPLGVPEVQRRLPRVAQLADALALDDGGGLGGNAAQQLVEGARAAGARHERLKVDAPLATVPGQVGGGAAYRTAVGAQRRRPGRRAHAHRHLETLRQGAGHAEVIRVVVRDEDGFEFVPEALAEGQRCPGRMGLRLIQARVDQHPPGASRARAIR